MSESSLNTTNVLNTISVLAGIEDTSNYPTQSITSLLSDCSFSTQSTSQSPSFSTMMSPTSITNSPISYNSSLNNSGEDNSQIKNFISCFNQQFDLSANSLDEIISLIHNIVSKKSKPDKQMKILQEENKSIKAENEQLNLSIADLKTKLSSIEYDNAKLKQNYNSLNNSYKCLQNETKGFQDNIKNIQGEWEKQFCDIENLSNQRNKLYEISNKQLQIINKLENSLKIKEKEKNFKKNTEEKIEKNNQEDDIYSLLCSVTRALEEENDLNIDNDVLNCKKIRDNSNLDAKERVIRITKYLVKEIKNQNENLELKKNEVEKSNKNVEYYQSKCFELLKLFENQLDFLQKLTHSSDLQNAVFFQESTKTSFILTEENKLELIRKCANLGKFVEETIGDLFKDKFEEQQNSFVFDRIFDLFGAGQMESSLKNVLSRIDSKDDINNRETFDLFAAQLFMNNLLKNHIEELHDRISQSNNEIAILKQQNNKVNSEVSPEVSKKLAKCEKKLEKIRTFLANFVEVDEKTPTLKLVKKAILVIKEESKNENKDENAAKEKEVQKAELNKDKICKKLIIQSERTKKQLITAQEELSSIKANCIDLTNKVESLNQQITDKNSENENIKLQLSSLIKENEDAKQKCIEEEKKYDEQVQTLTNEAVEHKNNIEKLKKQNRSLAKKIYTLQNSNKKLKEEIEIKTNNLKDKYSNLINDLQMRYRNALSELESKQEQEQESEAKNRQLSSELKQIRVDKRTLEMKNKSLEQKISINKQNAQSKISAQITATQIELSSRINSLLDENDEALCAISSLLQQETKPANLETAISLLEDDYSSLKKVQCQYADLVDDVNECKRILNIGCETRVSKALSEIANEKIEEKAKDDEKEKKWKEGKEECERMRKEIRRNDIQIAELMKWNSWARRSYRFINEADSSYISSDELRLSLEEALLASISHISVFYRIESLRAQKVFLTKYDKRVLATRSITRPTMRSVLIVALAARKFIKNVKVFIC